MGIMREAKQVIIVRADLKMSTGKVAAQCAHASLKVFLDISNNTEFPEYHSSPMLYVPYHKGSPMDTWLNGSFTKIVLKVNSEQELKDIYQRAQEAKLISCLIVDNGKTEFNGVPTATCVAIGPELSEEIDKITGHLELL